MSASDGGSCTEGLNPFSTQQDDDVDDDDGEDSDDRIETDDDIKGASSPNRTAPIESDSDEEIEEGSNDETNEDLGRGARTRAKVCNLSPV